MIELKNQWQFYGIYPQNTDMNLSEKSQIWDLLPLASKNSCTE